MITIRDLINECKNYQYSQEYYNIMKESAELMLMEQFVSDQQFAKENTTTFSEGYLMESVGDEQISAINESIKEKAIGIVKNITVSLNKAVMLVKTFAKKLLNIKDQYVIDDKFIEKVMNHKFDEACVNKISSIIEENRNNMPRVKVDGSKTYQTAEGFNLSTTAKKDVDFAVTMIQKSITVSSDLNAVNINNLTKELHGLVEILKAGEKVSDRMMEDIVHAVDQDRKYANAYGINIDFDLNSIEDIYNELESYGDISKVEVTLPDVSIQVYSETIGRVMPTIGDTLTVYNAVLRMRLGFKKLFASCIK